VGGVGLLVCGGGFFVMFGFFFFGWVFLGVFLCLWSWWGRLFFFFGVVFCLGGLCCSFFCFVWGFLGLVGCCGGGGGFVVCGGGGVSFPSFSDKKEFFYLFSQRPSFSQKIRAVSISSSSGNRALDSPLSPRASFSSFSATTVGP